MLVTMDKDQIIAEIARLIIGDSKASARPWDQYALIAFHGPGGTTRLNGFRYVGEGPGEPATPAAMEIEDRLEDLREATRIDGEAAWNACVFRLDRPRNHVSADFVYEDAGEWEVNPSTAAAVAARARPR